MNVYTSKRKIILFTFLDAIVLFSWTYITYTLDIEDEETLIQYFIYCPIFIVTIFEIPMLIFMWNLKLKNIPVLEIDDSGFHDRRFTKDKIPWTHIKDLYRAEFEDERGPKSIEIKFVEKRFLKDYRKTHFDLSLLYSYAFKIPTYRLSVRRKDILKEMAIHWSKANNKQLAGIDAD